MSSECKPRSRVCVEARLRQTPPDRPDWCGTDGGSSPCGHVARLTADARSGKHIYLNPVSALRNAEGFWPEANLRSFSFGRLQKILPYQPNRAALLRFLQSFHGSVEKGGFSAFFRFLKQKGGVVRNGPLLYFSRHPLPLKT